MTQTPAISILTESEASDLLDRREAREPRGYPPGLLQSLADEYGPGTTPEALVNRILEEVREARGQALRRWTQKLDGQDPRPLVLGRPEMESSWRELSPDLQGSLRRAAERIRGFHEKQPIGGWETEELGGRLGQRVAPIRRVGIYVPGGTAPLPSSLLMSALPAEVAGVPQLVVATPPPAAPSILAAAHLCGVDCVLQAGGAQAIGALAYGLDELEAVVKVVGAGGLFVTLAKKAVYGQVGIDGLAGPTETLILADQSARPSWLAADLLAQAEHDPLASALLLVTSQRLAEEVQVEVERRVADLSRAEIIRSSLAENGGIVVVENLERAADLANRFAAEHLCLAVEEPGRWAERIENAGGVFVGEHSFEVLGDYIAGPSHVMPTGGTARFASPLSAFDFIKITSWIELDAETARDLAPVASQLAQLEGLTAHASAAEARMGDGEAKGV